MRTASEKGSAIDERWHQRKDGSRFWASGVLTPLLHDGKTQGFVKILRDLTEARLQQSFAREMEERYRTLVDLSPQVVWQCDADGSLSYCNSYWCEFTGLDEQQSRGDGWLVAVSANDRQRTAEQWQAAARQEVLDGRAEVVALTLGHLGALLVTRDDPGSSSNPTPCFQ